MAHPLVVHCKKSAYDIYVGRPSAFGNPYALGTDGTRGEVVSTYARWLGTQPTLLAKIPTLKGKILGCWCAPALCHGDVLAYLANAQSGTVESNLKALLDGILALLGSRE